VLGKFSNWNNNIAKNQKSHDKVAKIVKLGKQAEMLL
jgi:hypothetical protein